MKVFIMGATGLIGRKLVEELTARGDQVTVLSRSAARAGQTFGTKVAVVEGDPGREGDWMARIDGHDAVINLTGESVADKAWTDAQKEKIRSSRIDVTRNLVKAVQAAANRPRVLANASAVGIYGDQGDRELTEQAPQADDFLARVCRDWEAAAREAEPLGVRVALVRIGVVLEKSGGALKEMSLSFKLFAGGPLGSGKQYFPWIHVGDVVGLFLFAVDRDEVRGPINAVAPEPVTMAGFSKALGRAMHRPSWMRVPGFALKLALGERADFLLGSARVVPKAALDLGYRFRFPALEAALKDQLG